MRPLSEPLECFSLQEWKGMKMIPLLNNPGKAVVAAGGNIMCYSVLSFNPFQ